MPASGARTGWDPAWPGLAGRLQLGRPEPKRVAVPFRPPSAQYVIIYSFSYIYYQNPKTPKPQNPEYNIK